jgi:hypothetical protein
MSPRFTAGHFSVRFRFIAAFILDCGAGLALFAALRGEGVSPALFLAAGLSGLAAVLLAVENFTNKPDDQGKEEWREVTRTELDRITGKLEATRKIRIPLFYSPPFSVLSAVLFLMLSVVPSVAYGLRGFFSCLCVALVFIPCCFFARVIKWLPRDLSRKIEIFTPILTADLPDGMTLAPLLRFDEDRNGFQIPEDLRVLLKKKGGRQDFMGAQFQLSWNNGPGGKVPYVYTVFLFPERGDAWTKTVEQRFPHFLTEMGTSREEGENYETVVLRQDTSFREDGYHTTKDDVALLLSNTLAVLDRW